MRTYYIVYCDADSTDQQSLFIAAPSEKIALLSLPHQVEVIEVLEFDEDEAFEFGLESAGGYFGEFDTDDGPRELDFDRD